MRKTLRIAAWLSWAVLAGALPAYANNVPAPDGTLSLILILPVAIFAFRAAGAKLTDREQRRRIARRILLGLSALLAPVGWIPGFLAMLVLFCYGLLRGAQVISRGQGRKRLALAAGVLLFTPLACFDYLLSNNNFSLNYEQYAAMELSHLCRAEATFKSQGKLDGNKKGVSEYGTGPQLVQAGLMQQEDVFVHPAWPGAAYRYVLILSNNPVEKEKGFFAYATPTDYGPPPSRLWQIVPGGSFPLLWRPRRHRARKTLATDESGVVREADLGRARPVTREEAATWKEWKQPNSSWWIW